MLIRLLAFSWIFFFACSSAQVGRSLPEINFSTLKDTSLDVEALHQYMAKHSLSSFAWKDQIGNRFEAYSPVFICGTAGILRVTTNWPLTSRNHHWSYFWTCEATPLIGSYDGVKRRYYDGFPLIEAGDSISQQGFPNEEIDHWSKKAIFDTLLNRLKIPFNERAGYSAQISSGDFVEISSDSTVSITF